MNLNAVRAHLNLREDEDWGIVHKNFLACG
jgi:hypothetical protein